MLSFLGLFFEESGHLRVSFLVTVILVILVACYLFNGIFFDQLVSLVSFDALHKGSGSFLELSFLFGLAFISD